MASPDNHVRVDSLAEVGRAAANDTYVDLAPGRYTVDSPTGGPSFSGLSNFVLDLESIELSVADGTKVAGTEFNLFEFVDCSRVGVRPGHWVGNRAENAWESPGIPDVEDTGLHFKHCTDFVVDSSAGLIEGFGDNIRCIDSWNGTISSTITTRDAEYTSCSWGDGWNGYIGGRHLDSMTGVELFYGNENAPTSLHNVTVDCNVAGNRRGLSIFSGENVTFDVTGESNSTGVLIETAGNNKTTISGVSGRVHMDAGDQGVDALRIRTRGTAHEPKNIGPITGQAHGYATGSAITFKDDGASFVGRNIRELDLVTDHGLEGTRVEGMTTFSGDGSTSGWLGPKHGLPTELCHRDAVHVTTTPVSSAAISAGPVFAYAVDTDGDDRLEKLKFEFADSPVASETQNVRVRWVARLCGGTLPAPS